LPVYLRLYFPPGIHPCIPPLIIALIIIPAPVLTILAPITTITLALATDLITPNCAHLLIPAHGLDQTGYLGPILSYLFDLHLYLESQWH